jgi:integrase
MPKVKLTDAAVERFKAPPGKRLEYFDATLPGFGLRVAGATPRAPEGHKSWVLFYRHAGKQKRLTLARPYPALSLKDARKEAGDALQLVSRGIDPAAERAAAKEEAEREHETFGTTVEKFLKSGMRGRRGKPLAPGYIEATRRQFENHVLPRWRDRELASITRRDVVALLDAIAACETAANKPASPRHARRKAGGPIAANRALAAIRTLFNWALGRDMVEINPCALANRPGEETQRQRTLFASETQELWAAFVSMGAPFGDFLRMTLLTGQRRSEVAGMRWADIDIEACTWTLAADATKAGRGHVVPLSAAAMGILAATPRKTIGVGAATKASPFVFTSEGDSPISGFSAAKHAADSKIAKVRADAGAGPIDGWSIHDLRRTAATEMGRLGIPEFIIAKVLNHASKGVTGQVYNRYEYLAEKRHALAGCGNSLLKTSET